MSAESPDDASPPRASRRHFLHAALRPFKHALRARAITPAAPSDHPVADIAGPVVRADWEAEKVPSTDDIRLAINTIGPREENAAGIEGFATMLKERGQLAFFDMLAKFHRMFDKGDGIDVTEMTEHQKKIYEAAKLDIGQHWDRRGFFGQTVWRAGGAMSLFGALMKAGNLFTRGAALPAPGEEAPMPAAGQPAEEENKPLHNYFEQGLMFYEQVIVPWENIDFGCGLLHEGYEKWDLIKMRQIKSAVLRLAALPEGTLEGCDRQQLQQLITAHTVENGHRDWVADRFLSTLLGASNTSYTVEFIRRASIAAGERNELDLEVDFDPTDAALHRRIFRSIQPNPAKMSWSDMHDTFGWAFAGLGCLTHGTTQAWQHHALQKSWKEKSWAEDATGVLYNLGQIPLGCSLINEFWLNWQKIRLEQLGDAVIELDRLSEEKKIDWKTISAYDLNETIENLSSPQEKFAGIYFLKTLLASHNHVSDVEDFVSRAMKLLDRTNSIDLPLCFNETERGIEKHKQFRPNMIDMEKKWVHPNAKETAFWLVPGIVCLLAGISGGADISVRTATGWEKTPAHDAYKIVHDYLSMFDGGVIGWAVRDEARRKELGRKDEQFGNTVTKLAKWADASGVHFR